MKKVKVAFLLNPTRYWLGGVYYYRNLFQALINHADIGIEPVVITRPDVDFSLFDGYPKIPFLQKTIEEPVKEFCENHQIDILSHVPVSCSKVDMPKIGWIPDFQHKYLPRFFSIEEIQARNKEFQCLAKECTSIIVSSYAAKRDFCDMFLEMQEKAKVLHFVVSPFSMEYTPKERKVILRKKYEIEEAFFYVPNQFWIHKNHKLLLEALLLLKKKGKKVTVISTGNTKDHRDLNYFSILKNFIIENQLEQYFKVLGIVPYEDVQILLKESLALINPSLFEGWSTTVEEAKMFGKKMLLSDIAVHHEQVDKKAFFFSPYDAEDLAEKMQLIIGEKSADDIMTKDEIERMQRSFVESYRKILEETMSKYK